MHIVQASRKHKSGGEYATDLHDQEKPAKWHRVSSSHDVEESRGRSRSERRRYIVNFEEDRIGYFRYNRLHESREYSRDREKDRKPELIRERERERDRGKEEKRESSIWKTGIREGEGGERKEE